MGLLSKLADPELIKPWNLLLNPDDPYSMPVVNNMYSEVNSGMLQRVAYQTLCHNHRKDILVPIALFIDAAYGDKNGNHSIEPVVAVPLIFKRSI